MTEGEAMPRLPTSGQLLGALVANLGIRHPVLQRRTARRYFSADLEHLVKNSTREEIIGAIAGVLTESGFIAAPRVGEDNYKPAPTFAATLKWHADHWDLLRSYLRRRTMNVLPSNLPSIWKAYVRLAIIDLALRVAAHLHLARSSPAALDLLGCTNRTARGDYLNQKRRQAGLSLEDFALEADVDNHTVDAWMYHGTRPSHDNLAKIAKMLADKTEGSTTSGTMLELRALYWISDVAVLLAEHIGAEAVDNTFGRLHQYAESTFRIVEDQFPAKAVQQVSPFWRTWVWRPYCQSLVDSPDRTGTGCEWREDLRSTGMDWVRRVLSANLRAHLAEVDDLTQEREGGLLGDRDVSKIEANAHYRRFLELRMQGKL